MSNLQTLKLNSFDVLILFLFCLISKCRIAALKVGGGDTAHGRPPGLVSPPTRDILKCTRTFFDLAQKKQKIYLRKANLPTGEAFLPLPDCLTLLHNGLHVLHNADPFFHDNYPLLPGGHPVLHDCYSVLHHDNLFLQDHHHQTSELHLFNDTKTCFIYQSYFFETKKDGTCLAFEELNLFVFFFSGKIIFFLEYHFIEFR